MATHSSTLVREAHGQRSLAGFSPWGHRVGQDLVTKQQLLYRDNHFFVSNSLLLAVENSLFLSLIAFQILIQSLLKPYILLGESSFAPPCQLTGCCKFLLYRDWLLSRFEQPGSFLSSPRALCRLCVLPALQPSRAQGVYATAFGWENKFQLRSKLKMNPALGKNTGSRILPVYPVKNPFGCSSLEFHSGTISCLIAGSALGRIVGKTKADGLAPCVATCKLQPGRRGLLHTQKHTGV